MFCRNCGEELETGTSVCPKCGAKQTDQTPDTVYCKYCGSQIDADCIICPKCGKQVQELKTATPNIIINNTNSNTNKSVNSNINKNTVNTVSSIPGKWCNKWTSFWLCLFFGYFGAHKFYEGQTSKGFLYLFTLGLFGFGWIYDVFAILFKPNPYFVRY